MHLGTALLKTPHLKEAEQALSRAVELDPDYAKAWVNLGGLKMAACDFEACTEANQRALDCRPDMVQAHYNKGLSCMYQGLSEPMLACFERVVELEPDNAGGQYHLAVALFSAGEVDRAKACLNRALELGYSPQPEFMRAITRKRGGVQSAADGGPEAKNPNQDPSTKEE